MIAACLAALAVWSLVPSPAWVRARMMFGTPRVRRRPAPAVTAAALTPVVPLLLLGPPLGLVVGIALVPVVHRAVGRMDSSASRQRTARVIEQLPNALDLMVAALEVGRAPVTAFALTADATDSPLGPELAVVSGRLAISGDPGPIWSVMASDPALAPVGRAFRRAEVSGMPVARIIAGVADDLRRDRAASRRERSRKVAVRTAAPLGACFLPAFFLIGIVPTIIATFRTFTW